MRIVISHFRNEQYLLPAWIQHHKDMFDHGVLVDYGSTDHSIEICEALVPDWEIRPTHNPDFESRAVDAEVMAIEREFESDWKIALNTTEFLCADLPAIETITDEGGHDGVRFLPMALVDPIEMRDVEPDRNKSLVLQRHYGFWIAHNVPSGHIGYVTGMDYRSRLYHRFSDGDYGPGRHTTSQVNVAPGYPHGATLLWFAYAPWTPGFRERKLSTNARRDPIDPSCPSDEELLEQVWHKELPRVIDLMDVPEYTSALAAVGLL